MSYTIGSHQLPILYIDSVRVFICLIHTHLCLVLLSLRDQITFVISETILAPGTKQSGEMTCAQDPEKGREEEEREEMEQKRKPVGRLEIRVTKARKRERWQSPPPASPRLKCSKVLLRIYFWRFFQWPYLLPTSLKALQGYIASPPCLTKKLEITFTEAACSLPQMPARAQPVDPGGVPLGSQEWWDLGFLSGVHGTLEMHNLPSLSSWYFSVTV